MCGIRNPTQLIATLERAKTGEPDPAAGPPPPPGLIGTIGDKGVKNLLDLVMAVNRGEMDRASAINTAMAAFAMDPLDAQTLFPEPAKVDALGCNEPAPVALPPALRHHPHGLCTSGAKPMATADTPHPQTPASPCPQVADSES